MRPTCGRLVTRLCWGTLSDGRRSETQPSVQYAGRAVRQTIYRDGGLAFANYPAYPTAVPL